MQGPPTSTGGGPTSPSPTMGAPVVELGPRTGEKKSRKGNEVASTALVLLRPARDLGPKRAQEIISDVAEVSERRQRIEQFVW